MNAPGLFSAAFAGMLSFLSPCVLPLIPAYLSFISGATAAELKAGQSRGKIFMRSLSFSAGFTLAFTLLGIIFSGGAMFVGQGGASRYIGIAGGILVIILGLNLLFDFIKLLDADARLLGRVTGKKTGGNFGAVVLGFAFAAGWSPCIGPILASILLFAGRNGNIPQAIALLFSYSLGFAIPFLLTGLFFDKLKPLISFFSRHGQAVRRVSGIVLILFGIAMAAGSLGSISAIASRAGYSLEAFVEARPGTAGFIGAGIWMAAGLALAASAALGRSRGISAKRKAALTVGGIAVAVLGIAEILGIFSILSLVAGWLTFSGI